MNSCIYEGSVRHRRSSPAHEFEYKLAMVYLDLDELAQLSSGRLVAKRPGLLRFRRRDYLGDARVPLGDAVRDRVLEHTGTRPTGPIRVLTQLRSFGLCFNPVSFYYCFDPSGDRIEALVAEVTNTPWHERHSYVIADPDDSSHVLRDGFDKRLHVSPFMGMDQRYEVIAARPGATLAFQIDSTHRGTSTFDATLALRRRELTRASTAWLTWRYPFATLRILALIYGQAIVLRIRGASVHPHPQTGRA